MNSIVKPSFYFSAYPLKAIKEPVPNSQPGSPYLKALLSGKAKSRPANKGRVLSLKYHHNNKYNQVNEKAGKLTKDMELTEKEWFNNYE